MGNILIIPLFLKPFYWFNIPGMTANNIIPP